MKWHPPPIDVEGDLGPGMTHTEVEKLLGKPNRRSGFPIGRGRTCVGIQHLGQNATGRRCAGCCVNARVAPTRYAQDSVLLLVVGYAKQFGGLGAEGVQLVVVRPVLLHPGDGLVVPLASLVLLAQLPVSHGQEEPIEAVAALAEVHGFRDGVDGGLPIACAILGRSQGGPVISYLGCHLDSLVGQFDRPARIACFGLGGGRQESGELVVGVGIGRQFQSQFVIQACFVELAKFGVTLGWLLDAAAFLDWSLMASE